MHHDVKTLYDFTVFLTLIARLKLFYFVIMKRHEFLGRGRVFRKYNLSDVCAVKALPLQDAFRLSLLKGP